MVLEELFRRPSALARFRRPPLGPELDGFCSWLQRQGFSRGCLRTRVWQASHFNQVLRAGGVTACAQVQRADAERFLSEHLPRCRCRDGVGYSPAGTPSAIRSLLDYLSQRGLVACPPSPCAPQPPVLEQYLDYLRCERNLSANTVKTHHAHLTPFLEQLDAPLMERLAELSPQPLLAFFTQSLEDRGLPFTRRLQGVLRSFLRFCHQQGYLERDLAEAIPAMRSYKLSRVPHAISNDQARTTLECIDRTTPVGRRDYAMLQLLHTYGVRGGQLRALQLQDIQWREHRIRFRAAKCGKEILVPLTEEVAQSVLEYLRHARPQAPYREVFLTVVAPFRPLHSPATVTMMVAKRLREAGLHPPKAGSHTFRHTFATRLLEQGQSLKTIADLLGHRHLNTTFIYTKVDLKMLHQLPLDWPEVDHEPN